MNFNQLENILKNRNIEYILKKNENNIELDKFMNIFNFPNQVYSFYLEYKYLLIKEPHFEIYELNDLYLTKNRYLVFSAVNYKNKIAYDTLMLNEANQWDIVNLETKYVITMTIGSFFSNKLINWLDKKREFWKETIEIKCKY